jgi:crotonobetainyl-CoA:carnitine CoA-transferase CaiB-like acyl-CoA transferase
MRNIYDGLRVIEIGTNAAGPAATSMMADFGAEVIKVERVQGGDDTRFYPPLLDGNGVYFFYLNRGKKSLILDLEDPDGPAIIKKLLASADVLVENMKPGSMKKFGLAYDQVKNDNPRLIMCSISGYGQTGPDSSKPGFDLIAQALSGTMDMTGEPNGSPTKCGLAIGDYVAANTALAAINAALYYREMTGKGQYIDISLLDCMVAMNGQVEIAAVGENPTRVGNHHPSLTPFGLFNGKTSSVIICAPSNNLWTRASCINASR